MFADARLAFGANTILVAGEVCASAMHAQINRAAIQSGCFILLRFVFEIFLRNKTHPVYIRNIIDTSPGKDLIHHFLLKPPCRVLIVINNVFEVRGINENRDILQ